MAASLAVQDYRCPCILPGYSHALEGLCCLNLDCSVCKRIWHLPDNLSRQLMLNVPSCMHQAHHSAKFTVCPSYLKKVAALQSAGACLQLPKCLNSLCIALSIGATPLAPTLAWSFSSAGRKSISSRQHSTCQCLECWHDQGGPCCSCAEISCQHAQRLIMCKGILDLACAAHGLSPCLLLCLLLFDDICRLQKQASRQLTSKDGWIHNCKCSSKGRS